MSGLDQDGYGFANDGSLSASLLSPHNTQRNWGAGVTFQVQLRIQTIDEVENTKSGNWEYSLNSGTWTTVTTSSSVLKAVNSTYFADGDDAEERLGVTGTFYVANEYASETGTQSSGKEFAYPGGCELTLSCQIVDGDVSHLDEIRVRYQDTVITHSVYADIQVWKPAGGRRIFVT